MSAAFSGIIMAVHYNIRRKLLHTKPFRATTNATNSQIHKYTSKRRTAESNKSNNNYFTANWMRSQLVSYKSSSLRAITTFISNNNAQLSPEKCFSVQFIAICFGSSTFHQFVKCEISEERNIEAWVLESERNAYQQLNNINSRTFLMCFCFLFGAPQNQVCFSTVSVGRWIYWRRTNKNSVG